MTLFELAYACDLYRNKPNYAKYNKSYMEFVDATNGSPDLGDAGHRSALLLWLRKWGCRQFPVKYEKLASDQILDWWKWYQRKLLSSDKYLWELGKRELESAGADYRGLFSRTASYREKNGKIFPVSIGPTGASKILFAIRPKALAPWDEKIREGLGYSELGYLDYMRHLKEQIAAIAPSCEKCGFQLADLPKQLGRDHLSVPKLIDDFYWITITKREYLPSRPSPTEASNIIFIPT